MALSSKTYNRAVSKLMEGIEEVRLVVGEFSEPHEDPRVTALKMVLATVEASIYHNRIERLAQACATFIQAEIDPVAAS